MSEQPTTPPQAEIAPWVWRWTSLAQRAQRATQAVWKRAANERPSPQLDPLNLASPMGKQLLNAALRPDKALKRQAQYNAELFKLWTETTRRMWGLESRPVATPQRGDRRFKDEAWTEHALFDFIKQSYLLTARHVQGAVESNERLSDEERARLAFFTRQTLSMMSPTNFAMLNPTVLRKTRETHGENLMAGLENLLRDLEEGRGKLRTRMTDEAAFTVGENVATAPGQVIYENELIQLLQFEPTTPQVHKRPLLIVPPWINKYYILDLQPENSFIRWAVSQGHTVFVVSWVNPDEALRHKNFEDYMLEGPLAAMRAIEEATGERALNAIGYCIGGSLMAATQAYLTVKGDDRIKSLTFFAAMVDFEDVGEMRAFINDKTLKFIDHQLKEHGYLPSSSMAQSFNMLRENDLIWNYVVDQYMLGHQPPPFDLLYWNCDSTRMPEAMHRFYLEKMYRDNLLAKPGGVTLAGVPIDLSVIDVPIYIVSGIGDHIAPWTTTYKATQLYQGPVRYVLAGSGHIAGIVNPPSKVKYGHRTLDESDNPRTPQEYLERAEEHPGSWWPDWGRWIAQYGDGQRDARTPGDGALTPIEPTPGRYVSVRADD